MTKCDPVVCKTILLWKLFYLSKMWGNKTIAKNPFAPYFLMRENLFIILRITKTISTKYEFKVIDYNLLNLEDLVYEYSISVIFVYSWAKKEKKLLKHCKAIFIWNQNGLHSREKMCTDTRGQWNLSCQQRLSRRVGQRCNFNQHLKFIRFPNVNSNTHREFELWVSMIFCASIIPLPNHLLFLNAFSALLWLFQS